MTTLVERPEEARHLERPTGRLFTPAFWGAVAIASMWVAVLFASVYGGDVVSSNGAGSTSTTIPSGIFVALFACLATVAVARRAWAPRTGPAQHR